MNVIVANTQKDILSGLDVDIIKSIYGEYEANEIVEMFKNFFYNRMILDVSAIKNFRDVESFQVIANGLDAEKIIFFLPEGSDICTTSFLGKLVSLGIYNFTTNIDGVKYLLNKPNTYKDVSQYAPVAPSVVSVASSGTFRGPKIIGFVDVTEKAGATTLVYMLKKELKAQLGDSIIAIEVGKNDFQYFNETNMFSIGADQLKNYINKYAGAPAILIDLNDPNNAFNCDEVIYLLEPSTLSLNKLMKRNRGIFSKLSGKKIVLSKSLLTNKDVMDFEYEAKTKIFYNLPPLDERKRNNVLGDFLARLGLLESQDLTGASSGKIFGLFRR